MPFDGAAGTTLRAGSGKARERAQWWSNRLHEANFFLGMMEAPIAAAAHGEPRMAHEMAMMNAEAFAAAGLVQLSLSRLAGRARPFVAHCREAKDEEFPCKEGGATLSFLSGHAMTSFVSAGLTCAHHSRLPLYGGGVGDVAACLFMISSAATTGILRIVADKHYASDVVIGSILGAAFGYGLPMLLHYRGDREAQPATQSAAMRPIAAWGGAF